MNNSEHNTSYGMSLADVLAVIFVVLKLTGVIKWSWIWVLSPIWISWIIALVVIALYALLK